MFGILGTSDMVIVRAAADGISRERAIRVAQVTADSLQVAVDEEVQIGDVIEHRVGAYVKRMQVLDVIPHSYPGISSINNHLEIRFELRSQATTDRPRHFDTSTLHPEVANVAKERLAAGHGNDAVLRAFELLESRVKALTGNTEIGKNLMAQTLPATGTGNGKLDIEGGNLATEQLRNNEREGYRHIFMGSMLGIRNIYAHGSLPEISPAETYELLALASHLMRRLDIAATRLGGKP